jgi:hypothetical protein
MEIPVIVEPHGGGYRARCRHPVEAEATGHSPYDARLGLEAVLAARVAGPFTVLPLEVTPDKPWIATAGAVPDDETTDAWLDGVAEYRRQCDAADQVTQSPAPSAPAAP